MRSASDLMRMTSSSTSAGVLLFELAAAPERAVAAGGLPSGSPPGEPPPSPPSPGAVYGEGGAIRLIMCFAPAHAARRSRGCRGVT